MSCKNRALLQLAALLGGLFVIKYVWPRPPFGAGSYPLINAAVPYFVWFPPFAVYAFRTRWTHVVSGFVANIGLLILYHRLLDLFRSQLNQQIEADYSNCMKLKVRAECLYSRNIDPPPPPPHWEWALTGFFVSLVLLYLVLAYLSARTAHRGRAV